MKVNLNLFYGMLKSNPPAFHILVTWMLKHNLTLLNIVEEEEFPSNLHVIYTRLQDTFKNQIPITQSEPNLIMSPLVAQKEESINVTGPVIMETTTPEDDYELVSIGDAIIFDFTTGKPCVHIRRLNEPDDNPGG